VGTGGGARRARSDRRNDAMNTKDGTVKSDASRAATMIINNKQIQMPVRSGVIGPDV